MLGVTLADIGVAIALSRREAKALDTAKRTYIHRKLGAPMPKATV